MLEVETEKIMTTVRVTVAVSHLNHILSFV